MSRSFSKDDLTITPEMRAKILQRDKNRCAVCYHVRRKKFDSHRAKDIHHIVPRSKGGRGDDEGNLVTMCHHCHIGKLHSEGDYETINDMYTYMERLGYDYSSEKVNLKERKFNKRPWKK